MLSWICQYSNVKKVTVLRSVDNMHDFVELGSVLHTAKGAQSFIDNHPLPGKNCYKVAILFKTGLTWRSNHFCTTVEKSALESLNHPVLTTASPMPAIKPGDTPKASLLKSNIQQKVNDSINPEQLPFKSRFLVCNAQTGNLLLSLPPDVVTENYSIRFFDAGNRFITEVPHINSAKLIFDTRNFQQKETVKFILKKNGVVLEEGDLNLNP